MKLLRFTLPLGIIMLMIAFGLSICVYRGYVYTVKSPFWPATVAFSLKGIMYLAMASFGICLYQLLTNYRRQGFFDSMSVRMVRWIGYAALLIALLNPIVLALESRAEYGSTITFVAGTVLKFVLESPLMLLVGLLTYLLADFMQKTLLVKRDNESFI